MVFYTQSTPAEELWLEGEFRVGTVSDLEVVVQTFENAGENPYTNHYAGATCSVTFSRADEASGIEGTFSCTGLKSSDDSETLNATGSFSATF